MSIWFLSSGGATIHNVFQQTLSVNRVKVEYTVQTNVDSLHSEAWYVIRSNGSPAHPVEQYYYWSVDSLVSYILDIPSQPFHIRFEIQLRNQGVQFHII